MGATTGRKEMHRPAAPAQPPLPVQQFVGTFHRGASIRVIDLLRAAPPNRDKLNATCSASGEGMQRLGFVIARRQRHRAGDALRCQTGANGWPIVLLEEGIYVIGFFSIPWC